MFTLGQRYQSILKLDFESKETAIPYLTRIMAPATRETAMRMCDHAIVLATLGTEKGTRGYEMVLETLREAAGTRGHAMVLVMLQAAARVSRYATPAVATSAWRVRDLNRRWEQICRRRSLERNVDCSLRKVPRRRDAAVQGHCVDRCCSRSSIDGTECASRCHAA
jgi:hypothetical protein